MERIRRGDENAFRLLFDRYYLRVLGLTRKYVDECDAEDVAQDIFVAVFGKIDRLRNDAAFESYLFRAAKSRCVNWLARKQRFRGIVKAMLYAADSWNLEQDDGRAAKADPIEAWIERLPNEPRRYIQLFYIEKRSRSEIAAIMGESASTAYRKISAARACLLDLLRENGMDIEFEGRHGLSIKAGKAGIPK